MLSPSIARSTSFIDCNASGATCDIFSAQSIAAVQNLLNEQGFIPSAVTAEGSAASGGLLVRIQTKLVSVKTEELILFTKQFRTMLVAGLPILKVLDVLENQELNYKSKIIEWAQKERKQLQFNVIDEVGNGYKKQYIVAVVVDGTIIAQSQHYSIKGAEQLYKLQKEALKKRWVA